jgi:triosephosphate isomerase
VNPLAAPVLLGVSLKMYFGHRQTVDWCRDVARMAAGNPALRAGRVELFILPSFPALVPAAQVFAGTPVLLGAQDLCAADSGPFTGEVSGPQLREAGCRFAEVGHAERRRLFAETDADVAAKTAAALRNGLVPVICVGEQQQRPADEAAAACIGQLDAALAPAGPGTQLPVVVAYEPVWAIGSTAPASAGHIRSVCGRLQQWLADRDLVPAHRVIYGGSAGPGLLPRIADDVDGMFLGRFAHDPAAVGRILDEVAALSPTPQELPR